MAVTERKIARVGGRLTPEDIAANPRLGRCKHCTGDIFYLKIFKGARTWWHENIETDYDHLAEPERG